MNSIWDFTQNLLGTLPIELHWLYGVCSFVLFITIILIIASPFLLFWILVKR